MEEDSLICKIYFYDVEWKSIKKIIGLVDQKQIFSSKDDVIEVRNYGNKIISKNDVEKLIIFERQKEIIITKKNLEERNLVKIEG